MTNSTISDISTWPISEGNWTVWKNFIKDVKKDSIVNISVTCHVTAPSRIDWIASFDGLEVEGNLMVSQGSNILKFGCYAPCDAESVDFKFKLVFPPDSKEISDLLVKNLEEFKKEWHLNNKDIRRIVQTNMV